jgi:hypothetical protein
MKAKKIIASGAAIVGLSVGAVGMVASTASAAPAQKGGCPSDKWFLFAPFGGDARVDKNGDGLICVTLVNVNGGGNSVVPGFTVKDNNNPV